jgi:hypothetical protein
LQRIFCNFAEKTVKAFEQRSGRSLDYTEASLQFIEEMIEYASEFAPDMPSEVIENIAQNFGCYILEVGRNEFGGEYHWYAKRDQPVRPLGIGIQFQIPYP